MQVAKISITISTNATLTKVQLKELAKDARDLLINAAGWVADEAHDGLDFDVISSYEVETG